MDLDNKLLLIKKLLKEKRNYNYFFNIYLSSKNIYLKEVKDYWNKFIKKSNNNIHFYLNTPFCIEKCKFCQYYSNKISNPKMLGEYILYIKNYLNYFEEELKNITFKGLYFGGGTASIYSPPQLEELLSFIFSKINFSGEYFKEFELNPLTTNTQKLDILYKYGFNRISFGVQSTNEKTLKNEGRLFCKYEYLQNIVEYAKQKGFLQINIDLIVGLNLETKEETLNSLKDIMKLKPDRITLYSLQQNKETSSLFGNSEEEYYKNIKEVYKFLDNYILNSDYRYPDNYSLEEEYMDIGITIELKDKKKINLKEYDTHVSDIIQSTFGVGFGSYSDLFGYGKYYIPDNEYDINKIVIKFQETNLINEKDIYLCRSIQEGVIDNKFMIENFGFDIIDEKKEEINFMLKNNFIILEGDKIFFVSKDISETYAYGFLFFDLKFILKHTLYMDKQILI